nr:MULTISPECIES: hypothetical protein [Nostoc]
MSRSLQLFITSDAKANSFQGFARIENDCSQSRIVIKVRNFGSTITSVVIDNNLLIAWIREGNLTPVANYLYYRG